VNHLLESKNGKHSAVIKIEHTVSLGTCTAFVVDDTTAVTARHCLKDPTFDVKPSIDGIMKGRYEQNYFTVYNSKGVKTFLTVKPFSEAVHADIAFLRGDFKDFNKLTMDVAGFTLKEGDEVDACGFAGGYEPPICSHGAFKGTMSFMGKMNAYLAKGMSGGPVFNKFGKVIGVNSSNEPTGLSHFGILFGTIRIDK
jgi:V8-like Glu-specific endopeptidase